MLIFEYEKKKEILKLICYKVIRTGICFTQKELIFTLLNKLRRILQITNPDSLRKCYVITYQLFECLPNISRLLCTK